MSVQTTRVNFGGGAFQTRRVYRFEVAESLAGPLGASDIVEVETSIGGGDCGFEFKVGESYFVDAVHVDAAARLSTSICSGTRSEVMAQRVIREVRAILAHEYLPDLTGTVFREDASHVPVM